MEYKVVVVGIGPGNPDYIAPIARRYIDSAKTLVGSVRALQTFGENAIHTQKITGDIKASIEFIREHAASEEVVVMVSGDPGYYSLLAALREQFTPKDLFVIPGISSFQLAFARLALPWQNARLLSLHGRSVDSQDLSYEQGAVLGILTDTIHTSKAIAMLLLEVGWPKETQLHVCTKLSYEDEEVISLSLEQAADGPVVTHCIMVVEG